MDCNNRMLLPWNFDQYRLEENGILVHKDKVYVPNFGDVRKMVLKEMQNVTYARNSGYKKTIAIERKQNYWPRIKNDVAEYIARCMESHKIKVEHRNPIGLLHPLPILEWKWDVVTINFITKLPKIRLKNDAIMVVVDKFTKDAHFIPVKTTHNIVNIAYIYMKEVS